MKNKDLILKIVFLIILIIISLFALVWTGNIRCRSIPGMCSLYWGGQSIISGRDQPSVLIIYDPNDKDGIGNPYLLEKLLNDKKSIGIHPNIENINYLSPEKLSGISLVIVDKAKKISTQKLEIFMNYVNKGGRLIWIADAGTELDINDKLLKQGDIDGTVDENKIGVWARLNNEGYIIRFDKFLGVEYKTRYCDIKNCKEKEYKINPKTTETITIRYPEHPNGKLIPSSSHPLTYALKNNLELSDNFAIVEPITTNVTPLKLDYGSNLISEKKEYGETFPLIVVSNTNKVVYYAVPPEYLCENEDSKKYISIVENMINGILK